MFHRRQIEALGRSIWCRLVLGRIRSLASRLPRGRAIAGNAAMTGVLPEATISHSHRQADGAGDPFRRIDPQQRRRRPNGIGPHWPCDKPAGDADHEPALLDACLPGHAPIHAADRQRPPKYHREVSAPHRGGLELGAAAASVG